MPRTLQHLHLRFALASILGLAWAGALTAIPPPTLVETGAADCPVAVTLTESGHLLRVEVGAL